MMLCFRLKCLERPKSEHKDKYFHSSIPSCDSLRHGTTSPISRLPPELLEEIIWLSVEEEPIPQHRYYVLSRVNQLWCQIIIGNPNFWTSVDLSWPPKALETILNRAGILSKLFFRLVGKASVLSPERENAIQHILALYSHRVETLHIHVESSIAKRCSEVPFPSLKNIIFEDHPPFGGPNFGIPLLNIAAGLQALDISKCRVDLPWDQLFCVLRNIRQLKIHFNCRKTYTSFLLDTPSLLNLEDLFVESFYGVDDDPDYEPSDPNAHRLRYPTQEFILTNLKVLRIHSFNMPTIMTSLRAPSLQYYEVYTHEYGSSHFLRRHLLPTFENFDYSAIKSLYVGFHASCSTMCILGSEQQASPDFSSGRFLYSRSSFGMNTGNKGFHIQLFHLLTIDAFLPKCLIFLFPKLTHLLQLSLQLPDAGEASEARNLLLLSLLKCGPNQCPNLETLRCCFPNRLSLYKASHVVLDTLKSRIKYGNGNLKRVRLENHPVDEDLVKEAEKLGVSVTFGEP